MTAPTALSHIRRGPDQLTTHFAGGGVLDSDEASWIAMNLSALRPSRGSDAGPDDNLSLGELKRIYLGARVVQGSVIASQLALPAVIEAGETVRAATLPHDLDRHAARGAAQTERFLSGAADGVPREHNDFPETVKRYIAGIAGILDGPYERAFERLADQRPELWQLALHADELQRLCWGHMRWRINEVVPAEQLAAFRARPLQDGTDELLALIKERTGVGLPPRVVQRDSQDYVDPREDWVAALDQARQDPRLALLCGIRFSVENAEIATLYCLGSTMMRARQGEPAEQVLLQQVRLGIPDIAWGTHLVTHNARFQSRLGARPNYYRSFGEFMRNVRKQADRSAVAPDGRIDWFDTHSPQVRGWCPAQNHYEQKDSQPESSFARKGHEAVAAWSEYSMHRFGVRPEYTEPSAGQLLASAVLFTTLHEGSPLRPGSDFMCELLDRL